MWRVNNRNEKYFSTPEKLAWEYVLPFMHLDVLDSDEEDVAKLVKFLEKHFTPAALKVAAKKIIKR